MLRFFLVALATGRGDMSAVPGLMPPRLLMCDFDEDWGAYGATLDAFLHVPAPPAPRGLEHLPKVCADYDQALFNWSDTIAGESWPQEGAFEAMKHLHYSCDPDSLHKVNTEDCRLENKAIPCIYGVVSASACLAVMFLRNLPSMAECCMHTAVGAVKGLHWLLRSGDKMLELLDSSSWPFTVRDIVTIIAAYEPVFRDASYTPYQLMVLLRDAHEDSGVPQPWEPGSRLWQEAQQAAHQTLALVAGWSWPPGGIAGSQRAGGQLGGKGGSRPVLVRIYAFGTHCSVMAEPVSMVALLLASEIQLRVTWRGTKEYCGYHSGNWPVVTQDADSPVREVFDSFHHTEDGPYFRQRSHRDSLRTPAKFEEAFRAALLHEGPAFAGADLAFCSEPALACLALYEAGKPVLGYFGVHIAFMLKEAEDQLSLYRRFRDLLVQDPRNTLATVAPYISLQILHHVPIEVPAVRPTSLYTLPAVYSGACAREVLLNKRPISFWDLAVLMDTFARLNSKDLSFIDATELHQLGRFSFKDWAAFRAAVYFPYDWLQTMAFYDWVNMGLPTFVPDLPMYTFSRGTNAVDEWEATTWHIPPSVYPHHYSDWDDLTGRVYWWLLTDFKALPGIFAFSSIPELFMQLVSQDELVKMSGTMRQAQLERVAIAGRFWHDALLRAIAYGP
mmetsp:Transcript_125765/g.367540  ORF Transcript_125765/g.367540 Transcript_125765/m.367540 type:complete len:672 (+) Transcript_125765:49-2064(+)